MLAVLVVVGDIGFQQRLLENPMDPSKVVSAEADRETGITSLSLAGATSTDDNFN